MTKQDPHDLVIRGGRLVTASASGDVDVGIRDGRIAELGSSLEGKVTLDARGLWLLPGGVDPHVHLTSGAPPGEISWVDDFHSGSEAALAGGITAVGNMTFPVGKESILEAVERDEALVREQAIVDVFLHPVLMHPTRENVAAIAPLCAKGVTSIKIFLLSLTFDPNAGAFLLAMREASRSGAMTLVHCEDTGIVLCCIAELWGRGHRGIEHYAASRPVVSEVSATQRAIAMCEVTGAPTYIVHVSSERALDACRDARRRGLPVYVETRPMYLHLTDEDTVGERQPLFVGAPPVRARSDLEALWRGLSDGSIDTLGSDHAPWSSAQKLDPAHTIDAPRTGVADLQTMLPMLFSEGVNGGRISPARFVELTATRPAQLFGLYPRKGTLEVGSDADLSLWDPKAQRTVDGAAHYGRADYSVYDGRTVVGWPRTTVRRGEIVFREGVITGKPGSGQVLRRDRLAPRT